MNSNIFVKIARFVFGFVLAIILIHTVLKITNGNPIEALARTKILLLLLAIIFHGIIVYMTSFRLSLLLRTQGIFLEYKYLYKLTLVGFFFGLSLPGAASGDLIKMAYITKNAKSRKVEAILAVVLDRTLGIFGLFIVAGFVIILSLQFLLNLEKVYRPVQIAAFIIGLGCLAGALCVGLLLIRDRILQFGLIKKILNTFKYKLPEYLTSKITKVAQAFDIYQKDYKTLLKGLILSIIVHSCLALNLFIVGRSVGENILRLKDYFLAAQFANAVAAIPLTPGGIGARDFSIAMLFSSMHGPAELIGVIPIIMTLILIFWGLCGGIIFVFLKRPDSTPAFSGKFSERSRTL
jgi:uncharacterized protein (TIRG00374 family)